MAVRTFYQLDVTVHTLEATASSEKAASYEPERRTSKQNTRQTRAVHTVHVTLGLTIWAV